MLKVKIKNKADFQKELRARILRYGYWSESVYNLNTMAQEQYPYNIWKKWHDEVRMEIRNS